MAILIGLAKNGMASHFCVNREDCETKTMSSHEILSSVTCIFFERITYKKMLWIVSRIILEDFIRHSAVL